MQTGTNENSYISILKDSLKKKNQILDRIIELNAKQAEVIKMPELDMAAFDNTIAEKEKCINEIKLLDEGFQIVYDRVKKMLMENKSTYGADIDQMQILIKGIVAKSMDIQAQEARNKENFQSKMVYSKKQIKTSKMANKVAANYYQNMNKLNVVDAQFYDTKK